MARTSPTEFFQQVKVELSKIVWPSRRETAMTTLMVVILTSTLGIFFFGIDTFYGWVVKTLLGLAAGSQG